MLHFRSVIDKPFYRYHDLNAGQVVEVGLRFLARSARKQIHIYKIRRLFFI